jgi:5'-nucleotidase
VPLILLTNDDGIDAEGLRCLEMALEGLGEILVLAPDRERSAVSHGLTIHERLILTEVYKNHYTLNGTPADCVQFALSRVMKQPPNLVFSGINHGANLGDDIMYSGTVAGAREASRHGIPSLAVSQAYDESPIRFESGAKFVRSLAQTMLQQRSNGGICLNINIPVARIRGVKITRQGCAAHFPHFNSLGLKEAPNAFTDAADLRRRSQIPLDFQAIVDEYISITPLQRDQTDYASVPTLLKVAPKLFKP